MLRQFKCEGVLRDKELSDLKEGNKERRWPRKNNRNTESWENLHNTFNFLVEGGGALANNTPRERAHSAKKLTLEIVTLTGCN